MDGETVRLITIAASAVVAGLGGAWIAGSFNRRNSEAAIAAAELQWDQSRNLEHRQWLRERKREAYADFLGKARDIDLTLSELDAGLRRDAGLMADTTRALTTAHLHLYAPEDVQAIAADVLQAIQRAASALHREPEAGLGTEFKSASGNLVAMIHKLERAIRADLSTA
ncbi:hypothetical protein [Lacisediminihabitans sp.]|uniref:hypothetical protein n=1 Tax=Lacisediminihabitans sp. TaxID=2787631 RepID=UPI00374D93C2